MMFNDPTLPLTFAAHLDADYNSDTLEDVDDTSNNIGSKSKALFHLGGRYTPLESEVLLAGDEALNDSAQAHGAH